MSFFKRKPAPPVFHGLPLENFDFISPAVAKRCATMSERFGRATALGTALHEAMSGHDLTVPFQILAYFMTVEPYDRPNGS